MSPSQQPMYPEVQTQYFPMTGGLDLISPTLQLLPGVCRDALNFEQSLTGGYTRILGYERFDGRPSPSDQAYWVLIGTITGALVVGSAFVGGTSGATGVVSTIDTTTIPGTTYIGFTKLTGTFHVGGEALKVSGVTVATVTGAEARNGAPTPKTNASYAKAAADIYRADIQAIPGSSAILGVWIYNNVVYAFRNNAGGTAAVMWKSTTGGWVAVSGVPTLLPGGKYEFVNANFGGTSAMLKMFGCDGVNKGFMFDGTTFTAITTGMASDTPNLVAYHKNYLWFTFDASLQFSSIGDPTTWSVVLGAGELALGETITSIKPYVGTNVSSVGTTSTAAMLIHTSNTTSVLYGSSNADWSLTKYSDTAGAIRDSVQVIDQPYYLSDLGIVNLSTVQAYGNFAQASLSQNINPFITQERSRVTTSCMVRLKSQYRLFFNDDQALYVTFLNGKVLGMMVQNLGLVVRCIVSAKKSDNNEYIYAGSDTGFIYQMEKGPNFDGGVIFSYIYQAFAAFKSPRVLKRFRRCAIEIKGTGYLEFYMSADLGWADPSIAPSPPTMYASAMAAAQWDVFVWDQFFWDGVNNAPTSVALDGTGENISLKLVSQGDSFTPFTVNSAIVHYTLRRQLR